MTCLNLCINDTNLQKFKNIDHKLKSKEPEKLKRFKVLCILINQANLANNLAIILHFDG